MVEMKEALFAQRSENYKARFWGEYWGTRIKRDTIHEELIKNRAGTLKTPLKCPIDVLQEREANLTEQLNLMEIQAQHEETDLSEEKSPYRHAEAKKKEHKDPVAVKPKTRVYGVVDDTNDGPITNIDVKVNNNPVVEKPTTVLDMVPKGGNK